MATKKRSREVKDSRPNPEELLIDREEEKARDAAAAAWKGRAAALKAALVRLSRAEKGALAAFLIDDNVRRPWKAMSSAEIGELLDHTANWVRVHKHHARKCHPCGGGSTRCGRDEAACAHERGRKTFYAELLKSQNTRKSN